VIGPTIGPYQILEKLGEGGMGEVYRARDARLGRDVAIKILPAAFTNDPDRLARFEREARVLASLNHPGIGAIYGLEESEGVQALVLELVEGDTLADRIARGPIPPDEATSIARQIADALDAAHEKGIVHRDLKPANVKLTRDGVVKVLDFGLAKPAAPADAGPDYVSHSPTVTVRNTSGGVILGTAAYMSPEQARGQDVDKRADIWAFGCVLFEMLTGRSPFRRQTVTDTMAAIIEREPDWTTMPAALSPRVRRLLQRCLAKDAKVRLRDIGDAKAELEEPSGVGRNESSFRRPVGRPIWMIPFAAVLGLVAAGAGWLLLRPSPASSPWQNPLTNASFTRYTDFEGSELDAAISPDGRFLLFLSNRSGPFDVWLSQVGSGEFVNVSKQKIPALLNDEIRNTGFSPHGEIWLRTDRTDAFGKRVSTGSATVPIIGGDLRPLLDRGLNPIWSPDGTALLYHEPAPGDPIFVADATGRNPRQIYAAAPGIHSHYLVWSPDARFIYFAGGIPPEEMDLWRVPAAGGTAERLTSHNASVAYPTFLDGRTLLYRTTAEDGSGPWLFAFDVESRISRRVSVGVEQYLSIAASADGRRLVATVSNPAAGLWTVPIASGVVDERSARRVAVPAVTARFPRSGPDYILYLSSREGGRGLWRFRGGVATEIWRPERGVLLVPPAVSPDGLRLALTVRVEGRNRLYVMGVDGANVRPLAERLDIRDSPTWAPDGSWIAVAVADGLVKLPVDSDGGDGNGAPVRLVEGLIRLPVWSRDGRFLLYSEALQGAGYTVKAVSPTGEPIPTPPLWVRRGGDRYRLLPDSRRVVYIGGDYGQQDFWLLDLVSGERRQLTNLQTGFSIKGFDVSPDGTEILFDRVRENSDVVLIDRALAGNTRGTP
jgi:serine/threonine protein kinase